MTEAERYQACQCVVCGVLELPRRRKPRRFRCRRCLDLGRWKLPWQTTLDAAQVVEPRSLSATVEMWMTEFPMMVGMKVRK